MEKCLKNWLGRRWTRLSVREHEKFKEKWIRNKCNFDDNQQQALTAEIGKDTKREIIPFRKKNGPLRVDKGIVYFEK